LVFYESSFAQDAQTSARDVRATQAFHRHDSRNSISAGTWLGRAGIGSGLLAFELDAVGCADGLSVFSALAWLRFGGRCRGTDTRS